MKKNIVVVALLVCAAVVVVEMKNRKNDGVDCAGCPGGACTLPIPIGPSPAGVEEPMPAPLPKLLDLGAGKCVPCKMMVPILDEMRETFAGRLDVEFIDVWENEHAGEQYGIRMIPTQIFFDATGRELFRHEGFFPREEILAKWDELGFDFRSGE